MRQSLEWMVSTHSVVFIRCMVIVGPCDFRVIVLPTAPDTSPSTVTGDRNRRMVSSDKGLTWNRLVRSDYMENNIEKIKLLPNGKKNNTITLFVKNSGQQSEMSLLKWFSSINLA